MLTDLEGKLNDGINGLVEMVHQAQCIPFPGGIRKKKGEINTGVGINLFKDAVSIDRCSHGSQAK